MLVSVKIAEVRVRVVQWHLGLPVCFVIDYTVMQSLAQQRIVWFALYEVAQSVFIFKTFLVTLEAYLIITYFK